MKTLTLHRNYFPHGVFSYLCDENGNAMLKAIERPWKNNAPGISCIPEGTYDLIPHNSPKFGSCYALEAPELGVTIFGPSLRTHILIHPANRVSELEGCIALGSDFGVVSNEWAVVSSRNAIDYFMAHLAGERAKLVIKRA
ncbi:DUF5675 family protein [Vibrio gazogenes]|uniref:DUF5675 domain-containing protein n=1 Tax=Vibrio gazogenes DSM 21264 = NBRC 103151 TaxID=1123492 RepID=A0A1M5F8I9_VIBGA|nr:DUF5675 family protein [Vibrio gazogenes]USP15452.1 DUF5675 family protein [Vibrio gazogenes]SHF87817.1 hypothetical protein SAMN02745781_03391 [Vibrio gazogenes DSM 21264] [Vibrio gazogenes DSM 21264 = NBRC 103151]SJN54522.1 hypothetical protein BQ6471_01054 [Vibrio gazogenes]HEG4440073.1 hypothetical protein [Vibrio cholerae]